MYTDCNETENIFVSSRGLLKSCNIRSNTPSSSINRLINYPSIDIDKKYIPTIYICNTAINYFAMYVIQNIDFSFILVSGDSDDDMPNSVNNNLFDKMMNNKYLIHWFCQNWIGNHNKVTQIPIGLDYHTMVNNDCWGPRKSVKEQENDILNIKMKSKPFWDRLPKCYSNFHFLMTTRHGYDRIDAKNNINNDVIYFEESRVERLQSWETQIKYSFVISPHGNGFDCHRTWEALVLGCIPIVKKSKLDDMYKDLPVLIVNDWSDVNQDLLDKTIIEYKNKEFNYDKLTLKYWIDKINDKKVIYN